jgi:LDH2 family malate/lactate/ureidoglycolate dehydrogenase
MKRFLARVKATAPRSGYDNVRLPGERGFAALAECRTDGVPLDEGKLQMLRQIAKAEGVEPVG